MLTTKRMPHFCRWDRVRWLSCHRTAAFCMLLGFLFSFMAPSLTYAGNDNVEVGRYVTATTKPTAAQINPLLAVVSVTFPSAITTVGDAMNYLLRFSSYTLIPEAQRTPAEKAMLTQPLPLVNRQFQAIPLQEALEVLAGKSVFTLVQDPLHRWVHFRLNQEANRLWREAQ